MHIMEHFTAAADRRLVYLLFFVIGASSLLMGCASGAQIITGTERDNVLAYGEPKADHLLNALNSNDYAAFSRDMDAKMKAAMPEAELEKLRAQVIGKVGKYVSREVNRVEKTGDFYAVVYRARFEQDDNVTVRLVFTTTGDYQISGLWLNSPKLQ